jgi:hypothetical protein
MLKFIRDSFEKVFNVFIWILFIGVVIGGIVTGPFFLVVIPLGFVCVILIAGLVSYQININNLLEKQNEYFLSILYLLKEMGKVEKIDDIKFELVINFV